MQKKKWKMEKTLQKRVGSGEIPNERNAKI